MSNAQRYGVGTVRIEPFSAAMSAAVAALLARAFVTNPLHIQAFGPQRVEKNEAFFQVGLTKMTGARRVALDGGRVVGFVHWVQWPDCQFSVPEKLGMLPAMVRGFGVGASWRVGLWLSAWSTKDPKEPHIHLGPIGVDPDAQGRGIGDQLMRGYCDELERRAQAGYLETDRPGNVSFYRRFGFEVVAEMPVLGVPNFLMRR